MDFGKDATHFFLQTSFAIPDELQIVCDANLASYCQRGESSSRLKVTFLCHVQIFLLLFWQTNQIVNVQIFLLSVGILAQVPGDKVKRCPSIQPNIEEA